MVQGTLVSQQSFPELLSDDVFCLGCLVSDEEVRKTVFGMAPLKAPRMDGFQAKFFQSQWEFMGPSICNFVRSSLGGAPLDLILSRTILVLIPKISSPERVTQFRPISICTVLYKILVKTIVNRLRPCMTQLISITNQAFFRKEISLIISLWLRR